MKNLILSAIMFMTTVCFPQKTGKGNSTFIPDISYSTKFLKTYPTIKNLEKLLPEFSVSDSSVSNEYNKETEKWDKITSIDYMYKFTYAGKYGVILEVKTNTSQKITEMKYQFDVLPTFFKRQQQLTINGYSRNEYSSKIGTKLNSGIPLDYYEAGNICVVLERSLYKFNIFRKQK